MKKFLLPLICAVLAASCIDEEFDFSDIDTDDIGIGSEESDFRMPLANIEVKTSALRNQDLNLREIFDEADTWLPSQLPGGADYVDLHLLASDEGGYRSSLISATLDEAASNSVKLHAIADMLQSRYASNFTGMIPAGSGLSVSEFIVGYYSDPTVSSIIKAEINGIADRYLTDLTMSLDEVTCEIGGIDISEDIIDMFTTGIGTADRPDAVNMLEVYGTVDNRIPVDCSSDVTFVGTRIRLSVDAQYGKVAEIPACRLFGDDLRRVIDDARLTVPVSLDRYYMGREFPADDQTALTLRLSLHKRGALNLDI